MTLSRRNLAAGLLGATLALLPFPPARAAEPRVAADLVPADAVFFLTLPDPGRSATAWRSTDLFRLWAEPEVQAFLERPLAKVPPNPALLGVLASLDRLEIHDAFAAVVRLEEAGDAPPHLLAGLRFRPDRRAELDALLEAPKAKLRTSFPEGRAETLDHRGQPVEIFRTGRAEDLLASATRPDLGWYLLSNDLGALRAALDRLDNNPDASPGLAADADFRAVRARMPAGVEALTFGRPQPLVERVLRVAERAGATPDFTPEQREQLKKQRAFGASTAFEAGGKIRDTLFVLAPEDRAGTTPAGLSFSTLPLAVAGDTLFYATTRLGLADNSKGPPPAWVNAALGMIGGDVAGFRAAFGDDLTAWVEWSAPTPGDSAPAASFTAALPVRDRAVATSFFEKLLAHPPENARWEKTPGVPGTHTLRTEDANRAAPTLALGERHLFLGLQPEGVTRALARERTAPAAPLSGSEPFRAARALVGTPDGAFAFLDARGLFERAYAAARPMVAMGAVFVPGFSDYVDADRLPAAETLARHLAPVALSQRRVEDGVILESAGPLSLPQIAGLAGAAAAAGGYLRHGHNAPPAGGKNAPGASGDGR